MKARFSTVAVLLIAGPFACGDSNLERGAACGSSDACATGLTCAAGTCRAPCNTGNDCPQGNACTSGLCMPLSAGTCGQAADCKTPPDACHSPVNAKCVLGACTYPRLTTHACDEACTTAADCHDADACEDVATARCAQSGCVYDTGHEGGACAMPTRPGVCSSGGCVECLQDHDCDPRAYGHDLCSAPHCVNKACSFTDIVPCDLDPLGTPCGNDGTCRSGYCINAVCCENACDGLCTNCGGDGRCNAFDDDDDRCGTIDCDGLDNVCRDYFDITAGMGSRCAGVGVCVEPNAEGCVYYSDAANTTSCRGPSDICDVEEFCTDGSCPSDAIADLGDVCDPGAMAPTDAGRCDGMSPTCRSLLSFNPAVRYFIEEGSSSQWRHDFFGNLDLPGSGTAGSVNTGNTQTGRYIEWASTGNSWVYCDNVGSGSGLATTIQLATIEAVVGVDDADAMAESIIISAGPSGNRLRLALRHDDMDPIAGRVTFAGYFGTNTATWTTVITEHTVVQMLVDGRNTASGDVLNLYVNGTFVARTTGNSIPDPSSSITITSTDSVCLGNDGAAFGAFIGRLYYAAIYLGLFDLTDIDHDTRRLQVSDAP